MVNFPFGRLVNCQYPNRNLDFHNVGETSDPAMLPILKN